MTSISWREIPLLRLLVPFILGIALAWWSNSEWLNTWSIVLFLCLTVVLLVIFFRPQSLRSNRLIGIGILLWFICFSYWRTAIHNQKNNENHFSRIISTEKDSVYWWSGVIKEITPTQKSLRTRISIHSFGSKTKQFKNRSGQLLVYLPPDSSALELKIGSKILFHSAVSPISPPLNPDAFDYASYQAKKNVFHQAFIQDEDWVLQEHAWTLRGEAMRWRQHLMSILRQHLASGSNELAVGAALILGNKDELEDNIRNAYVSTGAVHVLAVSGLHVGFIAWGISWLLSFGPFKKTSWKWIRLILSLLGVWAFALLTGLSPSVMRAACMFSFIIIGRALSRNASIYNILGASALFLLLIDPFLIFNIGFQLSYLAVVGIVYFQPRIYKALYPSNKVLDYFWKLSSVALAAQLATLPLSLFYFHQFPVYFLLSGIVVVTAASLILGLGVLLFITSFIPFVSSTIGFLLSSVLWLNNAFILALSQLPGGLITGVWIGVWILILLYVAIIFLSRFMNNKKSIELILCLASLVGVFLLNIKTQFSLNQQRKLIIYQQYKETIIDAFDGRSRYTFSTLDENNPLLNWGIQPHREKRGTHYTDESQLSSRHWIHDRNFIGFFQKRLLIIDPSFARMNQQKNIITDIALIRNTPNLSFEEMQTYIQAKHWIIDGSNLPTAAMKWKSEAQKHQIDISWTAKDGAFVLDF